MARYPEVSQGKHGHMGLSTGSLLRDFFPGAHAGCSLHKGAGIQPGLTLLTLSGAGCACPKGGVPSSRCTQALCGPALPFLLSALTDSRRSQLCGQRIQSEHGPVDNADEQEDKGDQRVEHGRHHLSHSPAGTLVLSTRDHGPGSTSAPPGPAPSPRLDTVSVPKVN